MLAWDDLRFVVALYHHKTMSAAADAMNANTATVSRRISRASDYMGGPLFVKSSEGWKPTDIAIKLAKVARDAQDELQQIKNEADQGTYEDTEMRINARSSALAPPLATFAPNMVRSSPGTRIEISVQDQSLAMGETDLVLSFEEPSKGNIIRKKVGSMEFSAVCSRYFENDLEGWISIDYGSVTPSLEVPMHDYFSTGPMLKSFGMPAIKQVVLDSPLAAILPAHMTQSDPYITQLGGERAQVSLDIWLFYHASRRGDKTLRRGIQDIEIAYEAMRRDIGCGYDLVQCA